MLPLESTSQKPPSSHSFHDSRSAPQRISRIKSHQRTGGLDQESGIKTWSCGQIHVVRPTNSWDNEPISRNGCFFSPSLLDVYDIESTTILRFTNHKSGIRNLSKVLVEIKHEGWTWANNRTQTKHNQFWGWFVLTINSTARSLWCYNLPRGFNEAKCSTA